MASEFLTVTAAACVLAQDIHAAVRKCDPYLPEWRELTTERKDAAVEEAARLIASRRRSRMAKVLEIRRHV